MHSETLYKDAWRPTWHSCNATHGGTSGTCQALTETHRGAVQQGDADPRWGFIGYSLYVSLEVIREIRGTEAQWNQKEKPFAPSVILKTPPYKV